MQAANAVARRTLPGLIFKPEIVHVPLFTVAGEPVLTLLTNNWILVPFASEEIPETELMLETVQKLPEICGAAVVPPVTETEEDIAEKQS